jgi:predicted amidohydrolase YtcJ
MMNVRTGVLIVSAVGAMLAGCAPTGPTPEQTADAIYAGGDIVTVDDAQPSAEAVAIVHTNGDATIDMFLQAYELARAGDFSRPWNVTTIHTQFMRKDHIEKFVKYKIRPSFYTLHTYYFAEAHTLNRGAAQAA